MTYPRFPRRRQQPATGDSFPGDSESVTEALARVPDWDTRTVPFAGRSYAAPPLPLTVVSVTVGDSAGVTGRGAAAVHAALTYIRLKTAILESQGHGDRIDHSEHARRRGDPVGPRSTVGEIRREAAALLLGAGAR